MSELIPVREVRVVYERHRELWLPGAIGGPEDVVKVVRDLIGSDAQEQMLAIFLDGRHQPVGYQIQSRGIANQTLVHPREVFQAAVLIGAIAIILVHNHPSGNLRPSTDDVDVAKRLTAAARLMGIGLLDFLIVDDEDFVRVPVERSESRPSELHQGGRA